MKITLGKQNYRLSPTLETLSLLADGFSESELDDSIQEGSLLSSKAKCFNQYSSDTQKISLFLQTLMSHYKNITAHNQPDFNQPFIWITGLCPQYLTDSQERILTAFEFPEGKVKSSLLAYDLPEFREAIPGITQDIKEMIQFDFSQLAFIATFDQFKDIPLVTHCSNMGLHVALWDEFSNENTSGLICICHPLYFVETSMKDFGLSNENSNVFPGYWLSLIKRYSPDTDPADWMKKSNVTKAVDIWKIYYQKALSSRLNSSNKVIDVHVEQTIEIQETKVSVPAIRTLENLEEIAELSDYIDETIRSINSSSETAIQILKQYMEPRG